MNRAVEGAVLITGVYGSGKSSVAQEIAHLLEKRNAAYALLDLDFLDADMILHQQLADRSDQLGVGCQRLQRFG